jgi:hypothetical protein
MCAPHFTVENVEKLKRYEVIAVRAHWRLDKIKIKNLTLFLMHAMILYIFVLFPKN